MGLYRIKKLISMIRGFAISNDKNIVIRNARKCYIHKDAIISSAGQLEIGSCEILPNALITAATRDAHLSLGENVYIGRNTIVACRNRIRIGNNVLFGPNVLVYDHDHNFDEHGRKSANVEDAYRLGEVGIDDNVWIGGCDYFEKYSHRKGLYNRCRSSC